MSLCSPVRGNYWLAFDTINKIQNVRGHVKTQKNPLCQLGAKGPSRQGAKRRSLLSMGQNAVMRAMQGAKLGFGVLPHTKYSMKAFCPVLEGLLPQVRQVWGKKAKFVDCIILTFNIITSAWVYDML